MNIIDTPAAMARALDQPLDPDLKRLLALRRDQMAGDGEVRFNRGHAGAMLSKSAGSDPERHRGQ